MFLIHVNITHSSIYIVDTIEDPLLPILKTGPSPRLVCRLMSILFTKYIADVVLQSMEV